jgi:hypothetical protein
MTSSTTSSTKPTTKPKSHRYINPPLLRCLILPSARLKAEGNSNYFIVTKSRSGTLYNDQLVPGHLYTLAEMSRVVTKGIPHCWLMIPRDDTYISFGAEIPATLENAIPLYGQVLPSSLRNSTSTSTPTPTPTNE